MSALIPSASNRVEVLVIGEPLASAKLAVELRMRGVRACVAASEDELFALLRQAWLRPILSIVDLSVDSLVRQTEVKSRSLIAALAGIPTLLIGAETDDMYWFASVVRVFPTGTMPDVIADTIVHWAR